jgi:hypothetical protein
VAEEPRTFTLPSDFDDETLFAMMLKVDALELQFRKNSGGMPQPSWVEFAMSGEGIRTRFRTMADSDDAFRVVIPKGAETHEDRYEEERSLFAFFTSLVSTFECTCYMLYSLGSQLDPIGFKMTTEDQKKAIGPKQTHEVYKRRYPQEAVTKSLGTLFASSGHFEDAYKYRNLLSHRGLVQRTMDLGEILGKHIIVGGPNSTVIPTMDGIPMDADLTAKRRAWIAAWTRDVLAATLQFVNDHIKPT